MAAGIAAVERVGAGVADEAFTTLVSEHAPGAYRLALRLCGDPHLAEDAVAESVARVLVRWRMDDIRDPGAYLRRCVVNELHSGHRRRAVAERFLARRRADDRGVLPADERFAETDAFRAALGRLGIRQQTVVVLRFYEDMSEAAIADLMRCSPGTVKSQLHRALANLRRVMEHTEVPRSGASTLEEAQ